MQVIDMPAEEAYLKMKINPLMIKGLKRISKDEFIKGADLTCENFPEASFLYDIDSIKKFDSYFDLFLAEKRKSELAYLVYSCMECKHEIYGLLRCVEAIIKGHESAFEMLWKLNPPVGETYTFEVFLTSAYLSNQAYTFWERLCKTGHISNKYKECLKEEIEMVAGEALFIVDKIFFDEAYKNWSFLIKLEAVYQTVFGVAETILGYKAGRQHFSTGNSIYTPEMFEYTYSLEQKGFKKYMARDATLEHFNLSSRSSEGYRRMYEKYLDSPKKKTKP